MWIARDKDGELYLYERRPESFDNEIFKKTPGFAQMLPEDLFPEVTFSSSPRRVSLIIDCRDCFDAEKFVDNETTPVETRDGREVTVYSTKRENLYSVVGEIEEVYAIDIWTATGKFDDDITEHEYDLMFCKKTIDK